MWITLPSMKTIILGAGIIGISTAWHLLERGHEVVVVDRQPDAALETSFANAAQISVEIGRGSIPSQLQPTFLEMEEALNNIPAEGAAA